MENLSSLCLHVIVFLREIVFHWLEKLLSSPRSAAHSSFSFRLFVCAIAFNLRSNLATSNSEKKLAFLHYYFSRPIFLPPFCLYYLHRVYLVAFITQVPVNLLRLLYYYFSYLLSQHPEKVRRCLREHNKMVVSLHQLT